MNQKQAAADAPSLHIPYDEFIQKKKMKTKILERILYRRTNFHELNLKVESDLKPPTKELIPRNGFFLPEKYWRSVRGRLAASPLDWEQCRTFQIE
ncbi:hypothetical protein OPV22_009821 [Ensete ventricosum]|uniref:Uncharacterized protein n=1 Tax=Ensete ventricosum TaxID=4639 RepID=A0AAV8PTT9_ENSVE|nr:hypothetical protein OPV22_009821 [Ensete ventricosum]